MNLVDSKQLLNLASKKCFSGMHFRGCRGLISINCAKKFVDLLSTHIQKTSALAQAVQKIDFWAFHSGRLVPPNYIKTLFVKYQLITIKIGALT